MTTQVLVLATLSGLVACAARSGADQATVLRPDSITVVGVVRATGSEPFPQLVLQVEGDEPTALVGPLRSELHQAVGLEVRVVGVAAAAVPPLETAVTVLAYDVLAMDGAPVHTGVLERSGDDLQLVGADRRWTLVDPPEELRAAVGAKVWVTGDVADSTLRIAAYGVLRGRP